MPTKFFIIACEPSGDSHGAHLVDALRTLIPDAHIQGLGGPKMKAAGVELLHDMTTLSALGFGDVIRQYGIYRSIFYKALKSCFDFSPNAVIVIDSPAFNLRFAKKIKNKFPVIYYISPQIWAWGKRRIHVIKKFITKMLVILPFEKELYDKFRVPCEFVGHPLIDAILPPSPALSQRSRFGLRDDQKAIGLMPGSRAKEVKRILPPMLDSALLIQKELPETVFFLTQAPNIPSSLYDSILAKFPALKLKRYQPGSDSKREDLYDLVRCFDFALIASGTATLEAALLNIPYFLLYKASWSTYVLGRLLVKVSYLGIVNILSGRLVVPEFIQQDIKPRTIAHQALIFIKSPELQDQMKSSFSWIRTHLGAEGASVKAAQAIQRYLFPKFRILQPE